MKINKFLQYGSSDLKKKIILIFTRTADKDCSIKDCYTGTFQYSWS